MPFGILYTSTTRHYLFSTTDFSTCFRLPDGGDRSPEVAWIRQERWDTLTPEQKQKFPPIAPNFVLELMSPTDNLKVAPDKMKEYMNSQVKLGWLINPKTRHVENYRLGKAIGNARFPCSTFRRGTLTRLRSQSASGLEVIENTQTP